MLGAIGAVMLLAAPAGEISPAGPLDPKAEEIIARTRATLSTYAIYWRVRIEGGSSGPEYASGATFRSGPLLRVEDVQSRAVADCAAMTGTQHNLSIGRNDYSTGRKIAERYCGIDADRKIISTRWLGRTEGKFGLVDEVRIVDRDGTVTYHVTSAGEVVGMTVTYRGSSREVVVEPMSFVATLPSGALFSKMSFATSSVSKIV